MEIVDHITENQENKVKRVKFEEGIKQNSTAFQYPPSEITLRSAKKQKAEIVKRMKGKRNSRVRKSSSSRKSKYSTILRHKKLKKQLDLEFSTLAKTMKVNLSRPSSVTSRMTACSYVRDLGVSRNSFKGNMISADVVDSVIDFTKPERQIQQKLSDRARNESNVDRPRLRSRNQQSKTSKYDVDVSLVPEVQCELEQSLDFTSEFTCITKIEDSEMTSEPEIVSKPIYLEPSKLYSNIAAAYPHNNYKLKKYQAYKTKRAFPCYEDSSIIKFKDSKGFNCEFAEYKGDNDEDTDDEDLTNGTSICLNELNNALKRTLLKQNSHYNF